MEHSTDSGSLYRVIRVGFVILTVLTAAIVPVVSFAGMSPVGVASASGTVLSDFEDGDASGWSLNGGSVTSASAYEGTYSLDVSSSVDYDNRYSGQGNAQFALYHNSGSVTVDVKETDEGGGGANFARISYSSSSGVELGGSSVTSHTSGWVFIDVYNIGSGTYSIEIKDENGDVLHSETGRSYFGPASGGVESIGAWGDGFVDFNGYGGISKSSQVSGTVTDSNGTAIESATVATNTSTSTTTGSDGTWSLDLADGTYDITASKAGYQPQTQTVTVSGSAVSNVDYSLTGNLTGRVTNEKGNPISGANVSTESGASTTTNASGYYDLALTDGDYTLSVDPDGYQSKSKSVTVSGQTAINVDYGFEMEIGIDDRTNQSLFADDPRLIVERPDGSATSTAFNHNDKAFVGLVDRRYYNLTVVSDYPAVWESKGFLAVADIQEGTLIMDRSLGWETNNLSTATASGETTPISPADENTPTLDKRLDVRFQELESSLSGDGTAVSVESPEPVENIEYVIRDENGTAVYNGSREFEEPTQFYQGRLSDNITNNASEMNDPTLDYSGEFANGSAFNGTADFSGSLGGGGGVFGPTGTSSGGGGTASTIGGVALLAGGAALAYRQFGGAIGKTVSNVAKRVRP